jgi:hypothetical protein
MSGSRVRSFASRCALATVVILGWVPSAVPASAAEPLPDLRVSATFDKPAYGPTDPIGVRLTVTNVGSTVASGFQVITHGNVNVPSWDPLPGATLQPGESIEVDRAGSLTFVDEDMVATLQLEVFSGPEDANPTDNGIVLTARVDVTWGSYTGVVYGDVNRNGVIDPGEELAGVGVGLAGGAPFRNLSGTTDASGRFTFPKITAGQYRAGFVLAGWVIPPSDSFVVDGVDDPDVVIRATQPISVTLTATIAFVKGSYKVGETAHLTVTLTNSSPGPLSGISANCVDLDSSAPTWGDLATNGPGVSIPAHATVTIDVSSPIPPEAFSTGQITLHCVLGSAPAYLDFASAIAMTRVPGGIAPRTIGSLSKHVRIFSFPVPGVKIYLRSQVTGKVVARSTTDKDGRFEFIDVPADLYDVGLVGPWRILGTTPTLQVYTGDDGTQRDTNFEVAAGPDQPDPDAQPSTTPAPQPGVEPAEPAEGGGGLAATGADVTWPAMAGLLALALGFGLVVSSRRPRAPRASSRSRWRAGFR